MKVRNMKRNKGLSISPIYDNPAIFNYKTRSNILKIKPIKKCIKNKSIEDKHTKSKLNLKKII
jgi:hypothetical protein